MTGFLQGLREGISGNLSALEAAALLVLAVLAWLARKPANKCQALIFCNAANFRFILAFAQ